MGRLYAFKIRMNTVGAWYYSMRLRKLTITKSHTRHCRSMTMAHLGEAKLYINDEQVGEVVVQRIGPSWSHGEFHPVEAFSRFAPLFCRWSLLLHAGGQYERLSTAVGESLRKAEFEIDRLHAKMH